MYVKDLPDTNVSQLIDLIAPPSRTFTVPSEAIRVSVNQQEDDAIRIGDAEYPATGAGLLVLGNWVDVPSKFLDRLPGDLLTTVLNTLLERKGDDVAVTVADQGIIDATTPNGRRIDPRSVVEVAQRVVGDEAQVVDWRRDSAGYSFEVITTPEVIPYAELQVRDISHGGLRFGQDVKNNLAPWVQPYIYRLVCTNGMEIPDETLKLSSRGKSLDDIIDELDVMARLAYGRVVQDIEDFYELKNERIAHPERTLVRIASEQGLSDSTLTNILATLPQYHDEQGNLSAFDLVNAITNQANDPRFEQKFNTVRKLQSIGGRVAFDHEARCPTCRSKLAVV